MGALNGKAPDLGFKWRNLSFWVTLKLPQMRYLVRRGRIGGSIPSPRIMPLVEQLVARWSAVPGQPRVEFWDSPELKTSSLERGMWVRIPPTALGTIVTIG